MGLVNGPISKTHFLNKKYPGVTEYLSKKNKGSFKSSYKLRKK